MSAEIETGKRCPKCGERKPATREYFKPKRLARGFTLEHQCRVCRNRQSVESHRKHKVTDPEIDRGRHTVSRTLGAPAYEPGQKPCVACHSMPWRVLGPRCPCCKLEYAREPKPELQLRRFDRVG